MMKTYPVVEIFDSIQGEGSMMGMKVTFIRFKGCNLACPWCDTKETWNSKLTALPDSALNFKNMAIDEIIKQCNCKMIVLTGGEPCIHDLTPLIVALHKENRYICIETNGTLPTPEGIDWVVTSPKPPEYRIDGGCKFNELKYVVDGKFNINCIPPQVKKIWGSVWLQPCDFGVGYEVQSDASAHACVELAKKYPYCRVGIQLHKIIKVK